MFGFLKKTFGSVFGKLKKKEEKKAEELKEPVEEKKPLAPEELVEKEEMPSTELAEQKLVIPSAVKEEKVSAKEIKREVLAEEGLKKEVKTEKKEKAAVEVKPPAKKIAEQPAEKKEVVVKKPVEKKEELVEEVPEKKGFFRKLAEAITTRKLTAEKFDELFWELELQLLENNTAVEVVEKIKNDLRAELVEKHVPVGKADEVIANALRKSLEELFDVEQINLIERVKSKKPFVICFVGINGSGKTTTIAKVANLLKKNGFGVVLAASDTFRAAAIDQLQQHADNLGVKLIRHDYGADAAAVAFDAIKHAEAKGKDVVLIDTAGRMHSNVNLMDEVKKIVRVAKPDLVVFVGESITGNDCVEQAKRFDEAVGIDGIILSKADVDEKGGAAISVSYVTKKPIIYIGVGQGYDDLEEFDKQKLLESIGL